MFGTQILDVAVGIIFIYFLVSVICSAVREGIESWMKTRAVYLERGIRELLHDPQGHGIVKDLYTHPLVSGLFLGDYHATADRRTGGNLPSYIPAKNFAGALLDIMARGPAKNDPSNDDGTPLVSLDGIRARVATMSDVYLRRALFTALDSAQGDLTRAQANVEAWYDSAMDRVSGWYKRSTQRIILAIALVVTVVMNVNTITLADYFLRNDQAREAIVAAAEQHAGSNDYKKAEATLEALSLPIGWQYGWGAPRRGTEPGARGLYNNAVAPFLGWLMTAFAATLGAPFWFDVLNKIMVIRSTVKPHEKSPEEGSEDRQPRESTVRTTPGTPAGLRLPLAAVPRGPDDDGVDGCGVADDTATSDEQLPAAQGGVR